MKAKNHTVKIHRHNRSNHELLPHELGAHLFAIIRRNIAARRESSPARNVQMTFAFQAE